MITVRGKGKGQALARTGLELDVIKSAYVQDGMMLSCLGSFSVLLPRNKNFAAPAPLFLTNALFQTSYIGCRKDVDRYRNCQIFFGKESVDGSVVEYVVANHMIDRIRVRFSVDAYIFLNHLCLSRHIEMLFFERSLVCSDIVALKVPG